MKRFLIVLFLLMAIDTCAQEVIQVQSNIKQILIDYLIKTDDIPADFIESLDCINKSNGSSNTFAEPVLIINEVSNKQVESLGDLDDIGIYTFYCPLCMPIKKHVFIKYYNEISLLEDLNDSEILIKQIDWLINTYLVSRDNFTHDYWLRCLKTMIEIYESNNARNE